MRRRVIFVVAFLLSSGLAASQEARFTLASVFADSMVLQQRSNVMIWGTGTPGTRVSLASSWKSTATAIVDSSGAWSTRLRTTAAGGPHTITVSHDTSTITLRGILLGEVWLCSGQSNMEMPLVGWPPDSPIANSAEEISHARFPSLRMFTIARSSSSAPKRECKGQWVACSPQTAGAFSATAYYFGKALHQRLRVPVGLVHASWGGTSIEAWLSAKSLSAFPEYQPVLKELANAEENMKAVDAWVASHTVGEMNLATRSGPTKWENLDFQDSVCAQKAFVDSLWNDISLPVWWEETELGVFNGAVWFRKAVTLPTDWRAKKLELELGPIDDTDETFVNGTKIGAMTAEGLWRTERKYTIPDSLTFDSTLTIAVRVLDNYGGGGLWGNGVPLQLKRTDTAATLSLAGTWKYRPVAEFRAGTAFVFGPQQREQFTRPKLTMDYYGVSPTTLHNGMIAPLIPLTLRGAIWYQGESNIPRAATYARLQTALIEEWRAEFRNPSMPFYFVQITPFAYGSDAHSELLREAQLQTLAVANTGMAGTLDIGDPHDIHPADKENVGKRLALWALAKTYGKKVAYSGPLYRSMEVEKNTLVLSFDHAGKTLVIKEHQGGNEFQIAGADSIFKAARVSVRGKVLVVSHPEIAHPTAVRYGFSDAPQATLFNSAGLPAPSFRTEF